MKKNLNILGIIPARGNSKRIPHKNMKLFHGKPLIHYTIKEAKKSKFLSKVIVSTEDKQLSNYAEKLKITVIPRPSKLAKNNSSQYDVIKHSINYVETMNKFPVDVFVVLQPTSPLRTSLDIDKAIQKFISVKCDSLVSVSEAIPSPYWMFKMKNQKLTPLIKSKFTFSRSQELPKTFQPNGAIFISKKEILYKEKKILGKNLVGYIMPPELSIDIDNLLDFKIAEMLFKNNTH